ncbi:TPA: UDP-N-acetylglucosamine 2-epimerase (non-hydrolyzing) [Vibrio vulnificus]|nr:UDP-N-acetylglucosamine 2-epimerase (non-hydrolyzing) [Vibrio vulnificus]
MKILTVVGARPQFVKAAVVSRAIKHSKDIEEVIVHTGQHYDKNMSDVFFEEMDIPKPKYSLNLGGGNHGEMTGRQLEAIEKVLLLERPDIVLVYGDTNSTIAGALSAVKLQIPVAHVEAGLRSFNMAMPEEVNRILTDNISTQLFCPTEAAIQNLKREGFEHKKCEIFNVGDVMYDAALYYLDKSHCPKSLGASVEPDFILATVHRADNTDNPSKLGNIIDALNQLSLERRVICPIHPRTRKKIAELDLDCRFTLLDPVSYFEMLWLLKNSALVLTDSGGLQKEAYFFQKYCVTMRDQTEWVELVENGVNSLVGSDKEKIVSQVNNFLTSQFEARTDLYGNGDAGMKIVEKLSVK